MLLIINCLPSIVCVQVCDRSCKNFECAFDGGDCGYELIAEALYVIPLNESTQYVEV
jgi:hypothetical protein